MADENIVTNIVANADFSGLIADVNRVTASLSKLQAQIIASDAKLANQVSVMNRSFGENLRRTGQFATHFVTLTSDVEKFGKNLDSGQLKLKNYFQTFQQHTKTQGGLIRELAKQQVALQNAIVQPLGKNAQGLMQYNVHIPQGLDAVKNKTALARQELQIMNKVIQDGGVQLINWGKNTQWAGRQLTVGLTVPLAAFGMAAAKSFREADAELVRLTKVYGGVAATSSADLAKIRTEVSATAKELAKAYGTSFKETIQLAADVAATGKTGNDLLGSVKETTRLAVLGEVDRQDAMKATLAIQTAFKQNTEQLTESINFLNSVENQTSTSLADLIEAIPKAGPVVQGLGGSVQDLALYLTAMKEGGINASEGANALKSALASLINPTKVAQEKFDAMGISLTSIVNDNAGDLTGMILELQSALDALDPLQKQQAIEQLFGKFQFARMNALFENLGKQGSQTLQVMDLMKTSSQDLANVASRELSLVTESASGKYKRAVESLKADLAGIGEEFLKVQTFFINVVDSIVKFISKLPDPIKTVLTFVTGLTAVIGPVIMLTGVLANFFGYIIKGASHFRALFKGGEGWKMLTPEILAASKAGSLVETTFYNDAKAATVLKTAIQGLIAEFTILEQKAKSGQISVAPVFSTMGGTQVAGRQVNPNHPLLSAQDTRSMSHMNPVAGMTLDQRSAQTIFGVVPGAPKVNQKIGNNPQIYASGDLPKIPGLTSIGGASTGVVAEEAAKWHAMTGALAMQSDTEIKLLKQEVARTGLITNELSASYQALLPSMTNLVGNAAKESAIIVADLQAGKIQVDQARAKIIALNAQVERMIAGAAVDIAGQQGRSINLTSVPLLNQPVVNNAGKSNMKELSRPGRTRNLLNQIARGLGVKTFGAPYSTETTIPKRLASGGMVYREDGSTVPEFKPMGTDTVPAMLTPGEFVVKADAVNKETLPFLKSLNETGSAKPFLSATMIHQGTEANQALAGNRPGVNLTGSYLANDLSSLHSRGLHPMALFYDQGLRLGYDKSELKRALNSAYIELEGSFRRKGESPINNAYYEKTATSIAMKHLKTVSRFSPTVGRNVRLAEELIFMGHQRNSQNKGIQAGSLRTTGFDRTELPRHLVGTGSGFSGSANQTHFNLAQELYDEKPSNLYTGQLGRGNTISQTFNSQRGHIGAKFAPSKWNMLLNMVRLKVGRTPIAPDARSVALNNKWRRVYSSGGPVYMSEGGMVPGYMSGGMVGGQQAKGYRAGGLVGGLAGALAIPLLGNMAGNQIGGTAGSAVSNVSNILPFLLPMGALGGIGNKVSRKLPQSATSSVFPFKSAELINMGKAGTEASKVMSRFGPILGRVLASVTPLGLAITGVTTALTIGYTVWKRNQEQLKLNALGFGLTAEAAQKAGLKYTDYNQKIKDSIQKSKDLMEANKLAYESMTSAGVPIKMTITEYQKLKEEVKGAYSEQIKLINSTKKSELGDVATRLKEQLVAAGLSAEDATKKIYAMFALSNQSGMAAASTVGNREFSAIQDAQGAAVGSLKGYNSAARLGNAAAQVNALNTSLTAIDSGISEIILKSEEAARKDKSGNAQKISQYEAELKMMDLLKKSQYGQTTITKETIKEMSKANPAIKEIASTSDTVVSVWQKLRLQAAGLQGDLSRLNADQTAALYNLSNAISEQVIANNKKPNGLLSDEYSKLKTLEDQRAKAAKDAAGQSAKAQIDSKKRLKDLQEQIDATNKLADSRIKALNAAKEDADLNREMESAKIEVQFAESTGNTQQAAQARLRYQSAVQSMQTTGQTRAIQAAADKSNAAPLAEIKKINDANEKLSNAAALAGDNITKFDKEISKLKGTIDRLNTTQSAYNLNLARWLDEVPGRTREQFDQTATGKYLSSGLVEPTKAAGGKISTDEKVAGARRNREGGSSLIPSKSPGAQASDLAVQGITTSGGNITANDIVIGGKSLKDGIGGNKDLNIKIKTTNNTAGMLGNLISGIGNPGAQPYSNKSYTVSASDLVSQGFSRENIFKGQSVRIGGKDYIIDGGIDKNNNVPIKLKKAGYGMKNIDPKIPTVVGDRGPELVFGNMVIPNLADIPYASPRYDVQSASKKLSTVGSSSSGSTIVVNQSFYQAQGENTDAFMRKVTQATIAAVGKDAKINKSQVGESRTI
jgi:TP901 family phage tail tape measure protein